MAALKAKYCPKNFEVAGFHQFERLVSFHKEPRDLDIKWLSC